MVIVNRAVIFGRLYWQFDRWLGVPETRQQLTAQLIPQVTDRLRTRNSPLIG